MARWLIVGALVALLACVPAREALGQAALTAYQILRNMIANKGRVSLEGERKTILYRNGQEAVTKQLVKQKAVNKSREETIYPPAAAGELVVSDGAKRWHYRPDGTLMVVEAIPPPGVAEQAQETLLRQLQINNQLLRQADEVVAGRNAYVVLARSRVSGRPSLKTWVDAAKWVELKSQRFDTRGSVTSTTFFTRINFAPVFSATDFAPRDLAAPQPPNSSQQRNVGAFWVPSSPVVQAQMTWMRVPRKQDLPKGWAMLKNVTLMPVGDQNAVVLHLTRHGVESFSLFQRQLQPGQRGIRTQDLINSAKSLPRLRYAHTWRLDSLELTLLGPRITKEDLDALKKAIEKAPKGQTSAAR
ncbi:MAG: outer membrane lipoprotein carrier protein LolA [Armatimonadota bacterium]